MKYLLRMFVLLAGAGLVLGFAPPLMPTNQAQIAGWAATAQTQSLQHQCGRLAGRLDQVERRLERLEMGFVVLAVTWVASVCLLGRQGGLGRDPGRSREHAAAVRAGASASGP